MKRDLDLARQLLIDIEGRGPDCVVTDLRHGVAGEADERLRYHIRLLIDGGFVKETDRAADGVPCVRLTNAGHELLELAAIDARWREAKWLVQERTGTQSLSVIKAVLARWTFDAAAYGERWRPRRYYRPSYYQTRYEPGYHRAEARDPGYTPYDAGYVEPRYYEPRYRLDRDGTTDEGARFARARTADYLERFDWWGDWRDRRDREVYYRDHYPRRDWFQRGEGSPIDEIGEALPIHVV